MALVKLGTSIAGLSGTIAGITFSRCKAGTTAKRWTRPPYSQTAWQQPTRQTTSKWPHLWTDLTPAERSDWNLLAKTPPETDYDPFGDVVLRSGYNWFVRVNNRRMYTFQAPQLTAPAPVTPAAPSISAFTITFPTGPVGMAWVEYDVAEFAATEYCVVHLNFAGHAGNTTKKTDFRTVATELANGQTETDFTTATLLRFGTYQAAWLATVQVFRQTEDSFRSIPTILQSVVTP